MWLEGTDARRRVGMSGRKVIGCWVIEGIHCQAESVGFVPEVVAAFVGFTAGEGPGQLCVSSLQRFWNCNGHPHHLGSYLKCGRWTSRSGVGPNILHV